MKTRLTRRCGWDRQGVSEVVGTILTLSITVVLFSSIIAMVDRFPTPNENMYTEFNATIDWSDWVSQNRSYIQVTNIGGTTMSGLTCRVVLSIDSSTFTLSTKGTLGVTYGIGSQAFGHTGPDNGNDDWDTGETWVIARDSTEINRDSNVGVMIVDIGRNTVVWSGSIQGEQNQFGPVISDMWVDSNLGSTRRDPVEFGRPFHFFAFVRDSDGDLIQSSVFADLSSIGSANASWMSLELSDPEGDGIFVSEALEGPTQGDVPIGYHVAIVNATDFANHKSSGVGRISVGQDLGAQPNLVISADDIKVSSENPTNGQTISVSATVKNYGGSCVGIMRFDDIVGNLSIFNQSVNFTISNGPDQVMKSITFIISGGGNHTLRVEAYPIDVLDAEPDNNYNFLNISVMPTILLVDDDNHPPDMSPLDTVSYMRAALDSCDFDYKLYIVNSNQNGPSYRLGEKESRLKTYDIVIWMCGYEKTNTLTKYDQQNLTMFLNDTDGNGTNGGSLWLIGQYLLNDTNVPLSFFQSNLKLSSNDPLAPGPSTLWGVVGHPISDEWNSTSIPLIERAAGESQTCKIYPDGGAGAEIVFKRDAAPGGEAINYEDPSTKARSVFFPWEYSRIDSVADQAQVTYKVIMWLGSIAWKSGRDLAISEQITTPTYVFYNNYVNVTAIIRNNGNTTENEVEALLTVDGRPQTENLTKVSVGGYGGTATVTLYWKATTLGTHVLKWVVDPNNHIPETNENNNVVPSYVHTGEVYVKFRILVVDDDESQNNGGTFANETKYATDSLARLNYDYEYNNSVNTSYIVEVGADGPTYDILKEYSAVIWVTGSATSSPTAGLTLNDNNSLVRYLSNSYGRLWLIGEGLFFNVPGSNLTNMLGIQSVSTNETFSGRLRGVDNSLISHGMDISTLAGTRGGILIPNADGNGVFYQDYTRNQDGNYTAISIDKSGYMALTCAFKFEALYGNDTSLVYGNNATDELTYMALHWLGRLETRRELRTTMVDITLSDMHPQIGSSYILRARIHNVGGQNASFLVRFKDGDTQIDSNSVSSSPDSTISAEVIWRPLYAGLRNLTVYVDPIGEVSEIFDWFNNNVTFGVYVYYFWDDMENGTSKWSHASTVININGEGPLDYYGSGTTLSTDISENWDWDMTVGVNNTTAESFSYPKSFWLEEIEGMIITPPTLDVVLVFDTSNSMGVGTYPNRPIDFTKAAALTLVENLTDSSRVAILQTGQNIGKVYTLNFTLLNPAGRALIGSTTYLGATGSPANELDPQSWTLMWNATGEAVSYAQNYSIQKAVLVVLSDGQDFQGADTSIADPPVAGDYTKVDMGSASNQPATPGYCPWINWRDYAVFDYHWGKYFGHPTTNGYWYNQQFGSGTKYDYTYGLLYSPIPIYTVGLSLETATTPADINNPAFQYTNTTPISGPAPGCQDNYDVYAGTAVGDEGVESGTPEYNLWRLANTSGAVYYYASSPEDLLGIFTNLSLILSGGINQTRSATPIQAAPTQTISNSNKTAVTESVNLTNLSNAKLSFRQKYSMLSGGHGGFLMVGYNDTSRDSNGDGNPANEKWEWKYIIPYNSYSGNLKFDELIYDNFGNRIFWCWNGISGRGTFDWEFVDIDLLNFIPAAYRNEVKIKFNYTQFGGGTGIGWYLDDVKLVVSRIETATLLSSTKDVWQMTNMTALGQSAHSGDHVWWNRDPTTGFMKPGIDNYLMSSAIVLTDATTAYLSAYFRFNINDASGSPPDGFRIEVTTDNGVTWEPRCNGIRTATGVSGTGTDMEDGTNDSKAYTGLCDSGSYITDNYWVSAFSMSRAIIDLSPYTGHSIHIRFRVVNNNMPDAEYPHYQDNSLFGGFFVDDIIVYGQTTAE